MRVRGLNLNLIIKHRELRFNVMWLLKKSHDFLNIKSWKILNVNPLPMVIQSRFNHLSHIRYFLSYHKRGSILYEEESNYIGVTLTTIISFYNFQRIIFH